MANNADPKFRVKVYELNDDHEWGDKGTGHVQFQIVQSVEAAFLFVNSESDSSLLLEAQVIIDDDVYQRQGDTIISWNDPGTNKDLALSFAESAGCQEIWEKLCAVRGVDPNAPSPVVEDEPNTPPQTIHELPGVESGRLQEVVDFLKELSPFMRDGVASTMVQDGFVGKLVELFKQLEATADQEEQQLRLLFETVKHLVMMNETTLLEQLLSDDYYIDIFSMLEYDPELLDNGTPRPDHRTFLASQAAFKQVIHFNDDAIISRIQQNFRVQYLKDMVMSRVMDDATFGTLNSIIFFNSIEILQQLQNDNMFLTELFTRLKALGAADADTKDRQEHTELLTLLQEMCTLSKNLQVDARSNLFRTLYQHGVIEVFEGGMQHPDLKTRMATFDILSTVVQHDTSVVRVFMLEQSPDFGLLKQLIYRILHDEDQGIKGHAAEILEQLLNPESMDQAQEKNQFLNTFYEKFLETMITIFGENGGAESESAGADPALVNMARNHVCELLTFFVQNHGYRIKYFVLRNNVVGKVCELMNEGEKYVALSAVRFVRACVGLKDEFYFRYMVKNHSFKPIVDLFKKNGDTYNLLNSAIIEMFEFIRKENIKSLLKYVTEKFEADLRQITYVDTFEGLWAQYEKNAEFSGGANTAMQHEETATSKAQDADAEEMYFDRDDEDSAGNAENDVLFTDVNATLQSTGGLVAYDDDDSNEESSTNGPAKAGNPASGDA